MKLFWWELKLIWHLLDMLTTKVEDKKVFSYYNFFLEVLISITICYTTILFHLP